MAITENLPSHFFPQKMRSRNLKYFGFSEIAMKLPRNGELLYSTQTTAPAPSKVNGFSEILRKIRVKTLLRSIICTRVSEWRSPANPDLAQNNSPHSKKPFYVGVTRSIYHWLAATYVKSLHTNGRKLCYTYGCLQFLT